MRTITTTSGNTYQLPEPGDADWGSDLTELLYELGTSALMAGSVGDFGEFRMTPLNITVTNNMSLDSSGTSLALLTAASSVTLNSTTPIQTPTSSNGKMLRLVNTHASNTITIPDTGNVDINGPVILGYLQTLDIQWLDSVGRWVEIARNS